MHIRRVRWQSYRIPFVASFGTAHGVLPFRDGAILFLETTDGGVGIGEIAPLPGFGGALDAALNLFASFAVHMPGLSVSDVMAAFSARDNRHPQGEGVERVVAAGLDLGVCDLLAQERQLSLAAWLAGGEPIASTVVVNATIGAATSAGVVEEALRAVHQGFRTVKLKVGVAETMQKEVERVAVARQAVGPDVKLRLDANGAWSLACARALIEAFRPYTIEMIEQPTLTLADFPILRAAYPDIAFAADESITDLATAQELIEQHQVDILVIKPMIVGGVRAAVQIIRSAEAAGVKSIVTDMLESGVGVCAALHVAACLRQPMLACGLATAHLLATDLLTRPLALDAGNLAVRSGPGLNVQIDPAKLQRYATGGGI